jgi:hypothetical protein
MAEKTIRIRFFTYNVEVDHPSDPGEKMIMSQTAWRGETVDLNDADVKRGEAIHAFVGSEPEEAESSAGVALDLDSASDAELAEWIENDKPTVQEVVDAADGDPELADRLLDAENSATGNDPRKGVVEGLAAVKERANE